MRNQVPSDLAVARIAGRQFGHISYAQLIAVGLTRHEIDRRVRSGALIRVHVGVYAVGHARPEAIARAAAALLACGPDAVLSYFSAAALWEMGPQWPALPEITVPAKRRPAGIRVHVHPTLDRRDIRRHRRIRVTSPARTLYDVAPELTDAQLARAINQARLDQHLRVSDLQDFATQQPRLLTFIELPVGPTRSEFEDRFCEFVTSYGLPTPTINARVLGYEVDALFPQHKVIVELDGYRYHHSRQSFERDRERDATLLAAGYVTIRITWQRLTEQPRQEAARLEKILKSRAE